MLQALEPLCRHAASAAGLEKVRAWCDCLVAWTLLSGWRAGLLPGTLKLAALLDAAEELMLEGPRLCLINSSPTHVSLVSPSAVRFFLRCAPHLFLALFFASAMRVPQLQASRVNSYVLGAVFAAVFVLFVLSFSRERDSSSSSSSSSVAPIEYEDSELGMLSIPKGLKKVLIDVGASTSPFPHEKDTLVVAVEPLLSSIYKGKYLDRVRTPLLLGLSLCACPLTRSCGQSDVTVLPVVISEQEGLTTLFETKNSVSSSLNQPGMPHRGEVFTFFSHTCHAQMAPMT